MPPRRNKLPKEKLVKLVRLKKAAVVAKRSKPPRARLSGKAYKPLTKAQHKFANPKRATLSTAAVERSMQINGDSFVASVKRPFSHRNVRLPEPSPFPSVCGSFTQRATVGAINDSGNGYFGLMAWPSFNSSSGANGPIWILSSMVAGVPTWTQITWSNQAALAANFSQIRAISMGVRFLDTATLLNRGGIGYLSNTNVVIPPTTIATLSAIKSAEDVVEFDLAKLHELGDELTWNPSTFQPSTSTSQGAGSYGYNLFTYSGPGAAVTPVDNKVFIWGEFPYATPQSLQVEIVVNWEAIPFNTTENLFDRQTVVGSANEISIALEKSGATQHGVNPTDMSFIDAAADLAGRGAKLAALHVLPQVPSMLKRLGRGFASMFSAEDFDNHTMAIATGNVDLSPNHCKAHVGLSRHAFLKVLIKELYGCELPDLPDEPEEKKDSEPVPPSNTLGSPSPSWVAVPSGLISNQPQEALSAIPKGNAAASAADGPSKARLRSLLFA